MVFHPQNLVKTNGQLLLSGNLCAIAHPCLHKKIIKELWHNFSFQGSELSILECEELVFSIGNVEPLSLDGCDYSIRVTSDGVCLCAKTEKDLIRGFMTLIDQFRAVEHHDATAVELDCCVIRETAMIRHRMVHDGGQDSASYGYYLKKRQGLYPAGEKSCTLAK